MGQRQKARKTKQLEEERDTNLSASELLRQGNRLRRAGGLAQAEEMYRRAIQRDPYCAEAWAELGCCLLEHEQDVSEAVRCFHRVLSISPPADSALDAAQDLRAPPGGTHGARDGAQEATDARTNGVQRSDAPEDFQGASQAGELGVPAGDSQSAAESAQHARDLEEAIRLLARIVASRPDWITGQLTLGCAYGKAGQHESARAHLAKVLQLDASLEAPVQWMFATMHYKDQNWLEAIEAVDRAIALGPDNLAIRLVRSRSCLALGRMSEGVESARRAIEIAPSSDFHSTLLYAMSFLGETTPEALYQEACRWNALYAAPLAKRIRPHTNERDPERRIKLGYVSPDLYNHAVMKFVPQLFEHHDPSRFEVTVYAVGARTDYMTEDLRKSIANYLAMPLAGSELAERVRADGVDILVDLAGHTMGQAFLAFAEKPAPIQVSWIGMVSTTGLSTIDYFLGDPHLPCPGTEHLFSEKVHRLPVLCSYRPFENVPVAPSPCLERGYITFGSFNNLRKITREVVKLWSAILHLVPDSLLLLKYDGLDIEATRRNLMDWFRQDGIAEGRLRFAGADPPRAYLEAFRDIDIALDPFPYNGGSTTLDTLWMGVPLVTLAGRMSVQCCGASLLKAAGLPDLVAYTPEEYIQAALFLVQAVQGMPDLRLNVRKALQDSPLMDEVGVVRSVEDAYREMWRTWCGTPS